MIGKGHLQQLRLNPNFPLTTHLIKSFFSYFYGEFSCFQNNLKIKSFISSAFFHSRQWPHLRAACCSYRHHMSLCFAISRRRPGYIRIQFNGFEHSFDVSDVVVGNIGQQWEDDCASPPLSLVPTAQPVHHQRTPSLVHCGRSEVAHLSSRSE